MLLPALAHADAIKLADTPKTITDAIAKIDPKHTKFGETLVIGSVEPQDPAKPVDTKPLRAALAKAKLKIIDDYMHGNTAVITVEGAGGARARISVDQGGGTIQLTARPRITKPPGACVQVPDAKHPVTVRSSAIDQQGESRTGETFWDYKTERIHDVDGDAIADSFVPVAKTRNACPEDVSFRVFVMRGTCGHDVGVIGPGSFQYDAGTVALDASGFRPFTMEAQKSKFGKRGIPELSTTTRRFAFKNGKYTQIATDTKTGVCHHCATWSCVAP